MQKTTLTSPQLRVLVIVCTVFLARCASPGDSDETGLESLFNGETVVVDMTHTLSSNNPVWGAGGDSPFKYEILAAHDSGLPAMGAFRTAEHYGTHIDAPIHGKDQLPTVDKIPLDELFTEVVVLDISGPSADDADYALSTADIQAWEVDNGQIPANSFVLLNTGWGQKWDDHDSYLNRDSDGRMHFPVFSGEAATFLVEQRSIGGIGIDNMSVDPSAIGGFPAHNAVNGTGKLHLENVANVHRLPATGAYLIIAPVKVENGSGGPVRIFGVIP